MPNEFKNVPAIEKCFSILQYFANSKQSLGISEISKQLALNKSTVFNIVYTLKNLEILEQYPDGKFHFGTLLYLLGNANGKKSELIQTIHPYLEKINFQTELSAFLGIRSGQRAVIIDKVDTAHDIKISSEIGMRLPLLAGAGGKALLSQLSDRKIDQILSTNSLKKFTVKTCIDKKRFKKEVLNIREAGLSFDNEEYIEGVVAFSVPLKTNRPDLQAAIWTVGLKQQVRKERISKISNFLKKIADDINHRFYMTTDSA
ncbi:MAG: IclR family transcriptional regulator [bacterium]|nr:IclR family transcriptional regulator [bacterium]